MAKGKVKLAFIVNAAKRKAACKGRKKGLMKKMKELSTLCGVDACAIVHCSELSPQLEFWPSESDAKRVVSKFQNLSLSERTKHMFDQEKILKEKIAKAEKKLEKVLRDNRQKELTKVMFDSLAGRSGLHNLGIGDLDALGRLINEKLYDIENKIESLGKNNPSQMEASAMKVEAMPTGMKVEAMSTGGGGGEN